MATNRDVRLDFKVSTEGSEELLKLSTQVRELGREGGEAAPKFDQLADEIENIARQTDALSTLNRLTVEVENLTAAQQEATAAARAQKDQLDILSQTTDRFRQEEAQAQQELRDSQRALSEKRDALTLLRSEYSANEKRTQDYQRRVRELTREVLDAKESVRQKKDELLKARTATESSERAEADLAAQYAKTSREAERAERSLKSRTSELDKSREAARRVGLETDNLASSELKLVQTLDRTVKAVQDQQAELKRLESIQDAVAASNERNVAIAQRVARERAIIEQRNADAARSSAQAQKEAAKQQEDALRAVNEQAARAAKAMQDAFAVTGVRSLNSIQREINEVNAALLKLRTDSSISGAEFDRAFRSGTERITQLRREADQFSGSLTSSIRPTQLLSGAIAQLAAAFGGIEIGREFINANTQLETLRRSLTIITGSTDEAARRIDFLREVADRTGQAVGQIADTYVKFTAATSAANVPLKTAEGVFTSITNAAGVLGLSTQRTQLILEALTQTVNKGKVSLEELQGQLGESLPGALAITAKGLNITTADLVKLVENGQLLTEDFLPALQRGLNQTFGDGSKQIDGFIADWNRLKNTVTLAAQTIGDTGAFQALGAALRGVGVVAAGVLQSISLALDTLFTGVRQAAILTAGVVQGDLKGAVREAASLTDQLVARQAKLGESLQRLAGFGDEAAQSQTNLGAQSALSGEAAQQATVGHQANAQAQQQASASAVVNAQAQIASGQASIQAGRAALDAAKGWAGLLVEYNRQITTSEQQVRNTVKLVEAKETESKTSLALAQLAGNEIAIRQTALAASNDELAVKQQLQKVAEQEIALRKEQIARLIAEVGGVQNLSAAKQKQVEDLQKVISAKEAELEKINQNVEAQAREVSARRVAIAAYEDNAAAVNALRSASENAIATQKALEEQLRLGNATQAQVVNATRAAAEAQALYRDALNDVAAAAARKITALQAEQAVVQASLSLERARAETSLRVAEAYADENAVTNAKINIKNIEIKAIQAKLAAARAEYDATIAAIEAERTALQQAGELTEAKRLELESRLQNAKAKAIEADANREVIRQIELEIQALRNRQNVSKQSADSFVADRQREAQAVSALASAEEQRARKLAGQNAVDNSGPFALRDKLNKGTLSLADEGLVNAALAAAQQNIQISNSPGAVSLRGMDDMQAALVEAMRAKEIIASLRGAQAASAPANTASSGSRTVNVSINGQRNQIGVASVQDANNLTNVLRQIESAANRA